MNTVEISALAARELSDTLKKTDQNKVAELMEMTKGARRIFITGAGRSLLMLRCFAMRLMQVGYDAYVVGDTITPALEKGDLLVAASGSGETENLVSIARRAKGYGGKVALITIFPESTLGQMADLSIKISAYTDKVPEAQREKKGVLPGGCMFEQTVLLLTDAMILELARKHNVATDAYFDRHANLE